MDSYGNTPFNRGRETAIKTHRQVEKPQIAKYVAEKP